MTFTRYSWYDQGTLAMTKTSWRALWLAICLAGSTFAFAMTPARDSGRVALEAAIQRWVKALNARDVGALGATMSTDVQLLDGANTVSGRDAAARALIEAARRGRLIATTRELTIADGVAWHLAELTQLEPDGIARPSGQALEIWKRSDTQWQLHRRITAANTSAAGLLTRPSTDEPVLDQPRQ